jgi:D-galactarolactone cycloisomerase
MKIARVEPLLIAVPYEHGGPKPRRELGPWDRMETLLVRVETDAGIVGWGEAFGFAVSPVTRAALTHVVGPLCIGRDPQDVPALMAFLRKRTQNMGRSGPVRYALSGIDLALWDIAGQVAGRPLHALFGGAKKKRIPTYASFLPYGTADLVARNVAAALARGYRHVKLHEHTVETVAAARRAGGGDLALMLDTNCAWSVDEAIAAARALAGENLTWLEEPVYPPDDYDGLARLRGTVAIPIAAGENVGTAAEVKRIVEKGALDILQPDAIKIGGLSEMREAVAAALAAGLAV